MQFQQNTNYKKHTPSCPIQPFLEHSSPVPPLGHRMASTSSQGGNIILHNIFPTEAFSELACLWKAVRLLELLKEF